MRGKSVSFLISILILSLFMMLVPVHSIAAEPVKLYVDPPFVVNPSVFFNVSVKIDNVVDLGGVAWELSWDPTLLRAVNMTEVMFHEITPQSEWDNIWRLRHLIDNGIGKATYAYLTVDGSRALEGGYLPISGNHTIAIIGFQVRSVGNCNLSLANVILANIFTESAISHDTFDGYFSNDVPPPHLPPLPIEYAQVLIYVDPHRVRNESVPIGDTFTVEVKLDSVSKHSGLISIRFGLQWNSSILDCTNVTEVMFHDVLPESEWQKIDWTFGIDNFSGHIGYEGTFQDVTVEELGTLAIFGNHTLATITFRIKNTGRCGLHLANCLPLEYGGAGDQMLFATRDGYFSNMLNGDLNGDNKVDLSDELQFAEWFGAHWNGYRWNGEADINSDQLVSGQLTESFSACANGYTWNDRVDLNGDQNGYKWNEEADINGDQWVNIFDAITLAKLLAQTVPSA
jgi:Cohesin domain